MGFADLQASVSTRCDLAFLFSVKIILLSQARTKVSIAHGAVVAYKVISNGFYRDTLM